MAVLTEIERESRRRFTVDEYSLLAEAGVLTHGERVELIDGVIYRLAPNTPPHQWRIEVLDQMLMRPEHPFRVRSHSLLRIDIWNEPEPDVMVLRQRSYRDAHPGPVDALIVIEVSRSSLTYDQEMEMPLYGTSGVGEVWIVDLSTNSVTRFTDPIAGGYRTTQWFLGGDTVLTDVKVEISVDELFA